MVASPTMMCRVRENLSHKVLDLSWNFLLARTMSDAEAVQQQQSSADNTVLVEDLLRRCHDLLNELEGFKTFLQEQKKENAVELRQFCNSVASELKSLEKVGGLRGLSFTSSIDSSV